MDFPASETDSAVSTRRRRLLRVGTGAVASGLWSSLHESPLLGSAAADDDATTANDDSTADDDSTAEAESPSGDWPMTGLDARNTNYQDASTGPTERLRLDWRTKASDFGSGLSIADGVLYAEGRTPPDGQDGQALRAIDLSTKEPRWETTIPESHLWHPAVGDGIVVVGNHYGKLYGVDTDTGRITWRYGPEKRGFVPVTLADGVAYGVHDSRDGSGVFAVEVETGTERWWREFDPSALSCALADGTLYVGGYRGDPEESPASLFALDASDGTRRWVYTPSRSEFGFGSPTVADGRVYFRAFSSEPKTWYLGAIDAETGREEWWRAFDHDIEEGLAVADGTLYAAVDGGIRAFDAETGADEWSHLLPNYRYPGFTRQSTRSPTVTDEAVYLSRGGRAVHVLDRETGAHRCRFSFGWWGYPGDCIVADGTLYLWVGDRLCALSETGQDVRGSRGGVTAGFEFRRMERREGGPPHTFRVGREIGFFAERSVGPIAEYEWDLTGDGSIDATGMAATAAYDAPGEKSVTLRVRSDSGRIDTRTKSFTVTRSP